MPTGATAREIPASGGAATQFLAGLAVNSIRRAAKLISRQLCRVASRYRLARRLAVLLPKKDRHEVEIIWGLRLSPLFDQVWYLEQHPYLRTRGKDPVLHYMRSGVKKGFNPHPLFDADWYLGQYGDVQASGVNPLWHYLTSGAAELRNPHPRFDAEFYVEQHPEAARNPLEHYLTYGYRQGWPTRRRADIAHYLPVSRKLLLPCPPGIKVDVIVPVYRGLDETRRCLESLINDPDRAFHRVIVIDDCSPEPEVSAWLRELAGRNLIELWRNHTNLGFVRSVNRGVSAASPDADVLLLNSDTELPRGWLQRLIGQAYKAERIGTVTPFSNNASICSYPSMSGSCPPFGFKLAAVDQAFRQANASRSVDIPTAIGFCMYIRRDCLDDIGLFDAERFGRGYGEESDFCLRASAKGWRHLLACDTFVFHAGEVSFGADAPERKWSWGLLTERYPHYGSLLAKFVRRDPAAPCRFAATIALFRSASQPKVLLICQGSGGGIERHVRELSRPGDALFLKLAPRGRDIELTGMDYAKDLALSLPQQEMIDLVKVLKEFRVSRVHVHHIMGIKGNLRELIRELNVPFDFTVHDYYTICPRIMLLNEGNQYCGEPGLAGCNACIRTQPCGAHDIISWRKEHDWLFHHAERVICPSEDVRQRLARYRLAERAIVVAHAPVNAGLISPVTLEESEPLRIAVFGPLAPHEGRSIFATCTEASAGLAFKFIVIGRSQPPLQGQVRRLVTEMGSDQEDEPAELIETINPHVIWFPAVWPETWSYTLSAAIASGRPIVATRIGAFAERLKGRPWTWLVDTGSPIAAWLAAFEEVRSALANGRCTGSPRSREIAAGDSYRESYIDCHRASPKSAGLLELRRPGRMVALVIPERGAGHWSPCAYIRLLQPLTHPSIATRVDTHVVDGREALRYKSDLLITQRTAVPDLAQAQALIDHCRRNGIKLVYDLDDDLMGIESSHPDWEQLRGLRSIILRLVEEAGSVQVATEMLRRKVRQFRPEARVVPNALDERIWTELSPILLSDAVHPIRILYMGTPTHAQDLALIEPACRQLRSEFGRKIAFEILGVTADDTFAAWAARVDLPAFAARSYPGFVDWCKSQSRWHIGVAPLVDDKFNRSKSPIKALEYAALGAAVVASDVPAYRGMIRHNETGLLVANKPETWRQALRALILDPSLRHRLANQARASLFAEHSIGATAHVWVDALCTVPIKRDEGHITGPWLAS